MSEYVEAEKFKGECLKLLEKVQRTKQKITITKRGRPIAQLIPFEKASDSLFGKMKGTVHIVGDILSPLI